MTVLYFRTRQHRRFELRLPGRHEPLPDPSVSLLGVMTGAWATQAVAAMAELGIADRLADRPELGADALAELTGTDPDALRRLLRYLSALGLLTSAADTYHPTALGQPLCTTTEFSLRSLAQLYGGPFYDSFAGLTYSVRTGRESFAHRYGQHHFTCFAERPELGTLFNRAMAASAEMFTPVPALADFSGARRVVDVGGGNGALLTRVLRTHGHLEGVRGRARPAVLLRRRGLHGGGAGGGRRLSAVPGAARLGRRAVPDHSPAVRAGDASRNRTPRSGAAAGGSGLRG
ncbi:hypothetical protein QF037_001055 [Streptomyces canus]|nr:hypothetical protein [Streptomyces canus]